MEDLANMLFVRGKVGRKHKDILKINKDGGIEKFLKKSIHQSLKQSRCFTKYKTHYQMLRDQKWC